MRAAKTIAGADAMAPIICVVSPVAITLYITNPSVDRDVCQSKDYHRLLAILAPLARVKPSESDQAPKFYTPTPPD